MAARGSESDEIEEELQQLNLVESSEGPGIQITGHKVGDIPKQSNLHSLDISTIPATSKVSSNSFISAAETPNSSQTTVEASQYTIDSFTDSQTVPNTFQPADITTTVPAIESDSRNTPDLAATEGAHIGTPNTIIMNQSSSNDRAVSNRKTASNRVATHLSTPAAT